MYERWFVVMVLSIIIPAFQAGLTIEKCVTSVLDSLSLDYEILVVNDGSYDTTASVCSRMASNDARIKLINQPNEGRSAARNRGIAESSGTWLMFLDADDWMLPGSIDLVLDYVDSLSGDIDVVLFRSDDKPGISCDCVADGLCFDGNAFARNMLDPIECNLENDIVKGYNLESVWAKAYRRRSVISQDSMFNVSLHLGEDALFNLPLFANGSVALSHSYVYHYETSNSGTCRCFNTDDSECLLSLYRAIRESAALNNLPTSCVKAYIASSFSSFCKRAAIYGDVSDPAVVESVAKLANTKLVSSSLSSLRSASIKNLVHNFVLIVLVNKGFINPLLKIEQFIYSERK